MFFVMNIYSFLGFEQAWTPTCNLAAPLCKVTGSQRSFGQTRPSSVLSQICKTGNSRLEAKGSNVQLKHRTRRGEEESVTITHLFQRLLIDLMRGNAALFNNRNPSVEGTGDESESQGEKAAFQEAMLQAREPQDGASS